MKNVLGALNATQHLMTSHRVTIGDGAATATVTTSFQAMHVLDNPYGDELWVLGGDCQFSLRRERDAWRITAATMNATWAWGNEHIMSLAAEAGES